MIINILLCVKNYTCSLRIDLCVRGGVDNLTTALPTRAVLQYVNSQFTCIFQSEKMRSTISILHPPPHRN